MEEKEKAEKKHMHSYFPGPKVAQYVCLHSIKELVLWPQLNCKGEGLWSPPVPREEKWFGEHIALHLPQEASIFLTKVVCDISCQMWYPITKP